MVLNRGLNNSQQLTTKTIKLNKIYLIFSQNFVYTCTFLTINNGFRDIK